MARLFAWLILLGVIGAVLGAIALPFALLEQSPRVHTVVRLNAPQVARAKALLAEHDPRRLRDGDVKALTLSATELSLVLNYVLGQLGGGASRIQVSDHLLFAQISGTVPPNPIGRYLNVDIAFIETAGMPTIDVMRIGHLTVPGLLANPVLVSALHLAYRRAGLTDPGQLLQGVEFRDASITLQYQWRTEIANAVRQQLVPPADEARLHEFHLKLVALTDGRRGSVPLPELAAPLFAYAGDRAAKGDPVADNRAALLVLSSYVTGRRLDALVPAAAGWPATRRLTVRVHGRDDLVKHFVNSAALAATGGQAVAQTLGLFKEIDDSRGGSGFSFIDLLADEAGTRFGKRATESRVMARAVQKLAGDAARDLDWVPSPQGLEEHMTEAEFNARFGGIDGAGYREAVADIARRIDAVALYR